MRVAMVVAAFPKRSETFLVAKFLGLLQDGVDVHIVCDRIDPDAWADFDGLSRIDPAVHVHVVGAGSPWSLDALRAVAQLALSGRPIGEWRATVRLLRRWSPLLSIRPDIVHVEFGHRAVEMAPVLTGVRARVIASFRGFDINYLGLENEDHYAGVWPFVDAVHTLGHDLLRRARRRGLPETMPVAIIPPAVDPVRFAPIGHDGDHGQRLRLLSVGRLHWKKGHEYTVLAVDQLLRADIDVELRIVGDGGHRDAIQTLIARLGLGERVRLVGSCAPDEVVTHLAWADVFVHAASSEGFANAVLEAQAAAVPVVCTDADGLQENVLAGVTGLVVPRRNPSALAAAIADLAGDTERRRSMGAAGRTRVTGSFAPADQIAAFRTLYESVLGRPRRPQPRLSGASRPRRPRSRPAGPDRRPSPR